MSKINEPPKELKEYLSSNLEVLVKKSSHVSFFGVVLYFIYAMNNWASKGKELIPQYNLIVLSTFSNFARFGYIPIHQRKVFFSFILSIIKVGVLPESWKEDIFYEIRKSNFYAIKLLEPVFSSPEITQVNKYWTDIYQGSIYRGIKGYSLLFPLLQSKIATNQINDTQDQWEIDVWDVTTNYVKIFMGHNSRRVFGDNMEATEHVNHLSKYGVMSSYKTYKEQIELKKLPEENIHYNDVDNMDALTTEKQKQLILKNLNLSEIDNKSSISLPKINKRLITVIPIIFILNLAILYLAKLFFGDSLTMGILFVETIIMILFGTGIGEGTGISIAEMTHKDVKYGQAKYLYVTNSLLVIYFTVLIISTLVLII